jgi:hypothetical protein
MFRKRTCPPRATGHKCPIKTADVLMVIGLIQKLTVGSGATALGSVIAPASPTPPLAFLRYTHAVTREQFPNGGTP